MSRPELVGDASIFYNSKEARKYNSSSRMIGVQREITERAIELLKLPTDRPCFILDVGCGSGLSGKVLEEKGHVWIGLDVSRDMLNVANERMESKRDEMNQKEEDDQLSEEEEDESGGDDEMDEDEYDTRGMREGTSTSTGDLLHHVRSVTFCCFPINDTSLLHY